MKKWSLEVLQRNAYFADPENAILGMLCDVDESVKRVGVNKVMSIRGKMQFRCANNFNGGFVAQDDDDDDDEHDSGETPVRKCLLPELDLKARSYPQLVNLNNSSIGESPAIRDLSDAEVENARAGSLVSLNPCHNQQVKGM